MVHQIQVPGFELPIMWPSAEQIHTRQQLLYTNRVEQRHLKILGCSAIARSSS